METTLRIARWLPRSSVNGPGERFVLWTQGCTLRCPGCWNLDTWSSAGGRTVTVDELMKVYLETPDVEGITISGGEPFQQARAVGELCEGVRSIGGSVMLFTGFDLDELTEADHRRVLASTDILVAGRYERAQRSGGAGWRGSSNQQVHFLSTRYGTGDLPDSAFEVHVTPDGRLSLTGFPPTGLTAADLVAVEPDRRMPSSVESEDRADDDRGSPSRPRCARNLGVVELTPIATNEIDQRATSKQETS